LLSQRASVKFIRAVSNTINSTAGIALYPLIIRCLSKRVVEMLLLKEGVIAKV